MTRLADAIRDLRPRLRRGRSFGASTTAEDLNIPLHGRDADLPHRMPAPTRMSTMPTAIALLNGKPPAATRFGRLAIPARAADAAASAAVAARTVGLLQRRLIGMGASGRRRDFPCSARAGRIPARATAHWHRSSRSAVGLRRGATEIVGIGGDVAEAAHAGRLRHGARRCGRGGRCPGRSRIGGSAGSCIGICGCRGRGAGGGGSARRLRGGRSSWPSGGRASRDRAVTADADEAAAAECRADPVAAATSARRALRAAHASPPRAHRHRLAGWRRGRAGRPRIRPCARPLPATAARG